MLPLALANTLFPKKALIKSIYVNAHLPIDTDHVEKRNDLFVNIILQSPGACPNWLTMCRQAISLRRCKREDVLVKRVFRLSLDQPRFPLTLTKETTLSTVGVRQ